MTAAPGPDGSGEATASLRRRDGLARSWGEEPAPDVRELAVIDLLTGSFTAEQTVAVLYLSLLGRPADPDGLVGWTDAMAGGLPALEVARALVASPEFRGRAPSQRAAALDQVDGWTAHELLAELGVAEHVAMAERSHAHHAILVGALYEVGLHRRPTSQERSDLVRRLAAGLGRDTAVREMYDDPRQLVALLGAPVRGLRPRLRRRWRRALGLAAFTRRVEAAENRQIAMLDRLADQLNRPLMGR